MSKGSYPEKLIIGTRGSPLALAQANEVRNKLLSLNPYASSTVQKNLLNPFSTKSTRYLFSSF